MASHSLDPDHKCHISNLICLCLFLKLSEQTFIHRSQHVCVLTATESRSKIKGHLMHMSPPYPGSLGCCPLSGGGSVVDLLRSSHCLWGFVLACITLCPY